MYNTGEAVAHWNGIHDLGLPADIPITVYVHSFNGACGDLASDWVEI